MHLNAASYELTKAYFEDEALGNGQLTLADGHKLTLEEVREWIHHASAEFESRARAAGWSEPERGPRNTERRANGQFAPHRSG